jgi:hypothetical protein
MPLNQVYIPFLLPGLPPEVPQKQGASGDQPQGTVRFACVMEPQTLKIPHKVLATGRKTRKTMGIGGKSWGFFKSLASLPWKYTVSGLAGLAGPVDAMAIVGFSHAGRHHGISCVQINAGDDVVHWLHLRLMTLDDVTDAWQRNMIPNG